jgi:hypothetical protein
MEGGGQIACKEEENVVVVGPTISGEIQLLCLMEEEFLVTIK